MAVESLSHLRRRARSSFWLVPAACVVGSVVLALAVVQLDQALGDFQTSVLFPGPPEGARSLLGAIISAMISFTGLVFSITVVVLSLTSGQFSPRVLRGFLQDRVIQWSLGVFVATFVYAMTVDREVLGTDGHDAFIPRIAMTLAYLLVLGSVGLFIAYIDHVANMIRVSSIITRVADESTDLLERRCPVDAGPQPAAPVLGPVQQVLGSRRRGVVVSVDSGVLVARARAAGVVLAVVPRVGDFLPLHADMVRVHGGPLSGHDEKSIVGAIALDTERTGEQDLAFGMRQLVDIAEKALSPGVNDPTTATQVIDVLHDLLRRLASRRLPDGRVADRDGEVRLLVPQYAFADLLDVAVAEIWHHGRDGTQVPERLLGMLEDLEGAALSDHRPAIRRWLAVVRDGQPGVGIR